MGWSHYILYVSIVIKVLTKEFAKIAFVCINLAYENLLVIKLNTRKSYLLCGALAPICCAISYSSKDIPVHGLVHIYVYCMARVVFNDILNSVEAACVAAVRH